MDLAVIGVVGTICGIVFGFMGYQKGQKDEFKKLGSTEGQMSASIEHIKQRIEDVLLEQRDINRTINSFGDRIARVEESSKSAHRRIDTLESDFKDCRKENGQ